MKTKYAVSKNIPQFFINTQLNISKEFSDRYNVNKQLCREQGFSQQFFRDNNKSSDK